MPHYPPPSEILAMTTDLVAANHPRLLEAGVTVLIQMHESKAGLKLHGYPCIAVAKIIPEKDRVGSMVPGLPDARITIDSVEWTYLSEAGRLAVLDHELTHFEVVGKVESIEEPDPDKPDAFKKVLRFVAKLDNAGRPKLKMRLHSWNLGGFKEIVERHGDAAVEKRAFRETAERYGQLLMAWVESDDEESAVTLSVNGGKSVMHRRGS
jgi:hypothetical protein